MSEQTKIQWCDSTVNFWSGCTPCSPGCANCYAAALSKRAPKTFGEFGAGRPRRWHESAVKEALRLNRKPWVCESCGRGSDRLYDHSCTGRKEDACHTSNVKWHERRVFSLSLGDWLDPEVPIEWLARMLDTIRLCADVEWILCTKRPDQWYPQLAAVANSTTGDMDGWLSGWLHGTPPRNVTILATVENQEQADIRIPHLLRIPAARRGLSMEPLLGPVDVTRIPLGNPAEKRTWSLSGTVDDDGWPESRLRPIHWLIIGGESGPKARPCDVKWIRSLVRQGKEAGVATFVKQLGSFHCDVDRSDEPEDWAKQLNDRKGADPSEWPEDLRVREWPKADY